MLNVLLSVFSVLGSDFLKYMEAFKPFLVIGLKNYAEYQVGVVTLSHFDDRSSRCSEFGRSGFQIVIEKQSLLHPACRCLAAGCS